MECALYMPGAGEPRYADIIMKRRTPYAPHSSFVGVKTVHYSNVVYFAYQYIVTLNL